MSDLYEKLKSARERAEAAALEVEDLEYQALCQGKVVLDIPMQENDSGADTIKGYLKALLEKIWEEGEGFSGKRPFGNSGWEYDLYKPLVRSGLVEGSVDEYGCINSFDRSAADQIIYDAIDAL